MKVHFQKIYTFFMIENIDLMVRKVVKPKNLEEISGFTSSKSNYCRKS